MLKIWLTWLQPSLGVLGTALVLSQPFCAYAATKPVAVRNPSKVPTQYSQWSTAKSFNGTTLDRSVLNGIAGTPDLAVRQLAVNSMVLPGMSPSRSISKTLQSNSKALANVVSPAARFPNLSAKPTKTTKLVKPQQGKHTVAAALARAIDPPEMVPVPGLFIGNSTAPVAKRVLPTGGKLVAQAISSASEIGAPTPLSAMMAGKTAVDPFPVVRPEMMQKLQQTPIATKTSTPKTVIHSLDPIATIPPVRPQAAIPKAIGPQATVPHSLDPIATIPSGLQRLLGNNLNSQPTIASTSVAKVVKTQPNEATALSQLISPTTMPASVSAASLRLATAQAYTSVPKFNIPGETVGLTAKAMTPIVNPLVVERKQQNFTATVVSRKSNYVAVLTPVAKQSWTVVNQRNNLGGLILGSQPLSTGTKVVSLSAPNTSRIAVSTGLPARNIVDFN